MAEYGKNFKTAKKIIDAPQLTYSEYTQGVFADFPPNIIIPESINNIIISKNDKHSDNIKTRTNSNKIPINEFISNNKLNNIPAMIVVINVTGTRFEVSGDTYSKLEPAMLASGDGTLVQINPANGCTEVFIERHPVSFAAILDYFRSGELHMPSEVCPSVFKRELEYWRVRSNVMESCCLRKYAAFHCNEETLNNCNLNFTQWRNGQETKPTTKWGRFRRKGWAVLDDPKSCWLAKVYLVVASFFVVLSIFLLAASTDGHFTRELNADEWEEFMSDSDLYNYWDHIYPGKTKPDKSGSSSGSSSTSSGGGGSGGGGSGSPPSGGVGKRSVPDDPRYGQIQIEEAQGLDPGGDYTFKTNKDIVRVGRHLNGESRIMDQNRHYTSGRVTLENEENEETREEEGHENKGGKTEEGNSEGLWYDHSEMLKFYMTKGVKQVLNKVLQDKSAENVESVSQTIVRDNMKKYRRRFVYLMTTGKEDDFNHDNDMDNYNDYNNEHEKEYDSITGRRYKRAANANTSNTTVNGTNDFTNLTNVYSQDCLMLSGEQLSTIIDALKTTVLAATDYSYYGDPPGADTTYFWLQAVEMVCLVYFTTEYILRLIFAPKLLQFIFSFFGLMDLISLATMYVWTTVTYIEPKFKYVPSAMDAVNALQIARVFRFFRLVKDVIGFRVLLLSIRTSWRELLLLLLYIIMAVTIFATAVYFCERENMKSIPEAAWWAIVTMTTVGYGDMTPKTLQGRLTGTACALSGVLLIAVTVPIFVNNFILFYEYSKITVDSEFYKDLDEEKNGQNDDKEGKNGVENNKSKTKTSNSDNRKSFQHLDKNRIDSGLNSSMDSTPSPPSSAGKPQAFEMMDTQSLYSRADSCKSLISHGNGGGIATTTKDWDNSSGSCRSPNASSAVSVSKVTPFVYDLELDEDDTNGVESGSKMKERKNTRKKRNNKPTSLA